MDSMENITGRKYRLFDYYGLQDAEMVIVAMASVTGTISEVVDYLNARGEKWHGKGKPLQAVFEKHFHEVLPKTIKKVGVLDRTKEPVNRGTLYLDVVKAFKDMPNAPVIVGEDMGLSSKDTRPSQIPAVFENLKQDKPKDGFTIRDSG